MTKLEELNKIMIAEAEKIAERNKQKAKNLNFEDVKNEALKCNFTTSFAQIKELEDKLSGLYHLTTSKEIKTNIDKLQEKLHKLSIEKRKKERQEKIKNFDKLSRLEQIEIEIDRKEKEATNVGISGGLGVPVKTIQHNKNICILYLKIEKARIYISKLLKDKKINCCKEYVKLNTIVKRYRDNSEKYDEFENDDIKRLEKFLKQYRKLYKNIYNKN